MYTFFFSNTTLSSFAVETKHGSLPRGQDTILIISIWFSFQGDDMAELPSKSVTEEKYEDENGHIVVKKVKVIKIRIRQVRIRKNMTAFFFTVDENVHVVVIDYLLADHRLLLFLFGSDR